MRIHLRRRQFVKSALGSAALLTTPVGLFGCKSRNETSALRDLESGASGLMTNFGPILASVQRPSGEWLGDDMNFGHETIRDSSVDELPNGARERAGLVIIGGGMSGLGAGYLMRDQKPIILELGRSFGGNSRGETWNGVSYALGAAYLVPPADDHPLMTEVYAPLGLASAWRRAGEGQVLVGNSLEDGFWEGEATSDPETKAQLRRLREYLTSIARGEFPEIPPIGPTADVSAAVKALDKENFLAHLERTVGTLHSAVRAYVEHYCWSSFGAAPRELSAAAGLNFMAGEIDGIAALPGGNAEVARRLMQGMLAAGVPEDNFRTRAAVRDVRVDGAKVLVTYTTANGDHRVIEADRVIIACQKFIAGHIVQGLPDGQAAAMSKLNYSAYVVANLLIDRPMALDQYDIYMLGDLTDTFESTQESADRQGVTDVILGHWAQSENGAPGASVLSLYRALPFRSGRARLHASESLARFRGEIESQLPSILRPLGVESSWVKEIRLARFGHPLVKAAPGLLEKGTAKAACQPLDDKIFFCNQDNWALPCIESALGSAISTAAKMG